MSHHRKNSVRDKVIAKKWISMGLQRVSADMKCGMVSFYRLGNFIC